MLRQLVVIVLAVALLSAAGLLAFQRLGWWNPGQPAAPKPTTVSQPHQPQPRPLPPRPAEPLAAPLPRPVPAPEPPWPSFELDPAPAPQPAPRAAPAVPAPQFALEDTLEGAPQAAPGPAPSAPTGTPEAPNQTPLDALNRVRHLAALPPVQRNKLWDAQCLAHARYMLQSDTGGHSEDPANAHYSPQGAACAPGHYFVTMRPDAAVARAIRYWKNGPFHLPQMLDPRLKQVGFAVAHDAGGGVQTAAALDLKRGRTGQGAYPVRFPAPGTHISAEALSENEYPDALPGCPGYVHPVGAPVALLQGPGGAATAARLSINGKPAESCLLTAQTFQGGSEGDTRMGRSVLAAQGVSVLLPRHPLPGGARVTVTFETVGERVSWAFGTLPTP